jgi:hypothetical protein
LSASGLIGETGRLLRSHGRAMLLVALIFLVPAELAVAHAQEDSEGFGLVAYVILGLVGYPWVYGALVATIARRVRSPLEPYGRTVDRLPTLVVTNFAAGLATLLALLLLIVPGLLLSARWSAAGPLIVLERRGPFEALETSNGLVRGRTWHVVGASLLALLVAIVLALPGALMIESTDSTWILGLGNALLDAGLFLPLAAFTYATYRQAQGL